MVRKVLSLLRKLLGAPTDSHEPDQLYTKAARNNPYPTYAQLRKSAPIHCVVEMDVWAASSCEHVEKALNRPDLFSSTGLATIDSSLQGADDPEHARVRKIAMRAISSERLSALEGPIRALTKKFVDDLVHGGTADFVAALATPLPLHVIALVLNFEPTRWKEYDRWSQAAISEPSDGADRSKQQDIALARQELDAFVRDHLQKCRAGEVAGVVSEEVIPDLTDEEAVDVLRFLLVAGNETTKNLLSNMVVALQQETGLFKALCEDPKLIPAMVEETLRHNSPVLSIARRTTQQLELGEQTLPANSPVFLLLGSANHSEDRFPQPDRFDLSRKQRHFAFGHGIHFCMGAALSRMEARIFLETLVERRLLFEPSETLDEIEWVPHTRVRGPRRLKVRARVL